ncbi:MAG: hypothetical protein HFE83_00625 [Lachnospiraceae bacterium]|jgi:spore maturation protein SpmB|nr:hypothetical protein [Lachnospiraceae bacterium]
MEKTTTKKGFLEIFIGGGKKGLNMWFNNMIPSIIVGAALVTILDELGLVTLIGKILGPVMAIFGLPGEAAAIWATRFMNMGAGILAAVPMFESGVFTMEHTAILLAMIMATTPPAKFIRMASAGGETGGSIKIYYALTVACSAIAGLIMRLFLLFL